MICVDQVSKRYGKLLANDNVSLEVQDGELAVLLGPNGAGKSTLIKNICGLLRFQGKIDICGYSNKSADAKMRLGYIPEMPAVYTMLTLWEHMEFIGKAYRLEHWQPWAEELFMRFELEDKREKLGQELSKGMQQKLSICCALLSKPKAIIFDEPFVGLDPHAIRQLKEMMRQMKREGASLLISTHLIDSMEESWDSTYIMKDGQILQMRRRTDEQEDESLEDLYFRITEGDAAVEQLKRAQEQAKEQGDE